MRPRIRIWRSPSTGPGYVWHVTEPSGIVSAATSWAGAMLIAAGHASLNARQEGTDRG
jgi:hypothetical protein